MSRISAAALKIYIRDSAGYEEYPDRKILLDLNEARALIERMKKAMLDAWANVDVPAPAIYKATIADAVKFLKDDDDD